MNEQDNTAIDLDQAGGSEMLKPLNVTEQERRAIKVALEGLLHTEKYQVESSFVGKIGKELLDHVLEKVDKLEVK